MSVPNKEESTAITSIKARRRDGDDIIVAEATGYSPDYVRKCVKDKRNNKLIVVVYMQLLDNRDEFIRSMKAITQMIKEGKYPVAK